MRFWRVAYYVCYKGIRYGLKLNLLITNGGLKSGGIVSGSIELRSDKSIVATGSFDFPSDSYVVASKSYRVEDVTIWLKTHDEAIFPSLILIAKGQAGYNLLGGSKAFKISKVPKLAGTANFSVLDDKGTEKTMTLTIPSQYSDIVMVPR